MTNDDIKRVAFISTQAFSLKNFRGPLILLLVKMGVCIYALAPDYDAESRAEIEKLGAVPVDYSLSRTGISPWGDTLDTFKLFLLLRKLKPDITFSYFIKPVIYGTIASWLSRVPRRFAMIEGLGYVFTLSPGKERFHRKALKYIVSSLYRCALTKTEQVFVLNDDDIAELCKLKIVRLDKTIKLGGIGVDLDEWQAIPAPKIPITFLMVARLLREKGVVEFANAAKKVKQLYPETRCILLGGLDQNPGSISQSEVEAWVKDGILEWPGHVDVKPWLAQCSVFVLPSYREGVPRSTQEALAVGRPIITTDAPGCKETVVEGENGYLIPVRDSEALFHAMINFINNPDLISRMGSKSRELAEERFDVHKINMRIIEAIGF